jgi:hypothetical protein
VAFSRNDTSKPLRTAQLKEFGPDNIRWTRDNRLITAGMVDNEPACGGPPKTEAGIRCSRGYIAATIDPKTMAVTEIARGPATPAFTGTAIAMRVADELWLGSFNADRLAYRSLVASGFSPDVRQCRPTGPQGCRCARRGRRQHSGGTIVVRARSRIVSVEGVTDAIVSCGGGGGSHARSSDAALVRARNAQQRAYSCAGSVAVAALLDRPQVSDNADHDIGGGGNAFFGNEELQFARVCGPEAGEQSPGRDDVLDEVHVPIEMEAEVCGAYFSHRHDRREVSFLATAHRRHRRAVAGRFGHAKRQVSQGHRLKPATHVIVDADWWKQESHLCFLSFGIVKKLFDQPARVSLATPGRFCEHRADAADAHRPASRTPEGRSSRTGEDVVPLHQRESLL